MTSPHVVIVGASGLVGRAVLQHFVEHGYKVTTVSRRKPENTYGASWASLDLTDADACQKVLSPLTDVVQLIFAAVQEEPNVVAGWLEQKQIERNGAMMRNTVEAIVPNAHSLKNITIFQGVKAYGLHVHPIRYGAREDIDEDRSIANFYWLQEDYLKERQKGQKWSWNVLRVGLVVGLSVGSSLNLYGVIGVYAAIFKERGEPLYYPNEGAAFNQQTDSDLIAEACEWCLRDPRARNQCYNLDNGDSLVGLKDDWRVIAEALGMEAGPVKQFSFITDFPSLSEEWDIVREKHKLKAPALDAFVGASAPFTEYVMTYGPGGTMPVSLTGTMSCIKIRRHGFTKTVYAEEMIRKWFKKYQDEHLLPAAA